MTLAQAMHDLGEPDDARRAEALGEIHEELLDLAPRVLSGVSVHDRDEAVQDVALGLWRLGRRIPCETEAAARGYLKRALKNHRIDAGRKAGSRRKVEEKLRKELEQEAAKPPRAHVADVATEVGGRVEDAAGLVRELARARANEMRERDRASFLEHVDELLDVHLLGRKTLEGLTDDECAREPAKPGESPQKWRERLGNKVHARHSRARANLLRFIDVLRTREGADLDALDRLERIVDALRERDE